MTSSSRVVGDKLSLRLQTLHNLYTNETNIWDIGCDHGFLGLSFADASVESIHLVDASVSVIDKLLIKNIDSYITKPKVLITHSSGQNLKITSSKNLILIAGMGGEEIGEIIKHLLPQLDSSSLIAISPHRKILELRGKLRELPVTLTSEVAIEENGQFYQILALRPGTGAQKISLYGEELWSSEIGKQYREHQLKHFSFHQDLVSKGYVKFLKSIS